MDSTAEFWFWVLSYDHETFKAWLAEDVFESATNAAKFFLREVKNAGTCEIVPALNVEEIATVIANGGYFRAGDIMVIGEHSKHYSNF
jgi:hypothetical protein